MAVAAARSALRSCSSFRSATARISSGAVAGAARPSSFRLPNLRPAAPRILRSPVELSSCVESLMPMHSATASALMTSMLAISRKSYGWLSEAIWWSNFGDEVPELQKFAVRVLSLTCTASACERNWSTFNQLALMTYDDVQWIQAKLHAKLAAFLESNNLISYVKNYHIWVCKLST